MKSYLTRNGCEIVKSSINNDKLEEIKEKLTVKPKTIKEFGEAESFEVFKETDDRLIIPKFYAINELKIKNIKDKLDNGEEINLDFKGNLRDYQIPIVNKLYDEIKNKSNGGVLSVPCGRGKTLMAINMITKLKRKTLVVVHKSFLMKQWKKQIELFTDAKVGIIRQNKVDIEDKDIVIGMLASIAKRDYGIFNKFGFVVLDECHHTSAKFYSQVFPKIVMKYSLGLSATPDRSDGTSKVFYWYIGNIIYKEKPSPNDNVNVKIYKYKTDNPDFKEYIIPYNGLPNFSKLVTKLTEMKERNDFISNIINEIRNKKEKRKILVLSDRLEQLHDIECMISESISRNYDYYKSLKYIEKNSKKKNTKCYNCVLKEIERLEFNEAYKHKTAYYVGGMTEEQHNISENADIIFATYGLAAEGLDIPSLNCVILASPKSDVRQSVGRILRQLDYDFQPLIIDIEDILNTTIRKGKKRRSYYSECKYQMNEYYVNNNQVTNIVLDVKFTKTVKFRKQKIGFKMDKDDEEVIRE